MHTQEPPILNGFARKLIKVLNDIPEERAALEREIEAKKRRHRDKAHPTPRTPDLYHPITLTMQVIANYLGLENASLTPSSPSPQRSTSWESWLMLTKRIQTTGIYIQALERVVYMHANSRIYQYTVEMEEENEGKRTREKGRQRTGRIGEATALNPKIEEIARRLHIA
ncbi:hypothetical protein TESG_02716 [Trichophyton tonsurans CBS 112818]|uniref:Uncharacterized protein n=1 Tax=Trichophyton tonsurans (strain CBS 112818) TaxID=647933 RepID=F2RV77_TRIT1|nr:hypothetical protein TESG_02716 [Trichophyton tonsurans CBS 112818]